MKDKEKLNKITLSKTLINELNKALEDISMNNISFEKFEKYYNLMVSLVKINLTKEASKLAITLNNASVILDSPDKQDKYREDKAKIEVIVADIVRKYYEESSIKLSKIFEDMKQNVQKFNLSFEKYCYYVDLLKIAYMTKLEDLDYLEIAKCLQSTVVTDANTYEEAKIYNQNQLMLSEFIKKLSAEDKTR